MKSALAHFQTFPHKDASRQLHHAFQEIENKPFILHPSSFSTSTFQRGQLLSSTQIPVCLGFPAKNKHDSKRLSYFAYMFGAN